MDANSQSTVDASQFNRKIQEWMVASGKSAADTLRAQGRLLIKQCLNFTPPKSLPQGRNAIKQDLFGGRSLGATKAGKSQGIFFLADDYMLNNEPTKSQNIRLFISKSGTVYGTDVAHFRPDATMGELKAHHQSLRSKATGRTSLAGSYSKDVGRWKFMNVLVVKKSIAKKYFAAVATKVGRLKAGWLPAYTELGGVESKSWITRHASGAHGIIINLLSQKDNPNITIGNYAKGAKQIKHIVTNALRARAQAIERDIKLYIRGIKERTQT